MPSSTPMTHQVIRPPIVHTVNDDGDTIGSDHDNDSISTWDPTTFMEFDLDWDSTLPDIGFTNDPSTYTIHSTCPADNFSTTSSTSFDDDDWDPLPHLNSPYPTADNTTLPAPSSGHNLKPLELLASYQATHLSA
jgi:hypothetical protein